MFYKRSFVRIAILFIVLQMMVQPALVQNAVAVETRQTLCVANPVLLWNEAALAAIRSGVAKPTIVTRQLFLLHTAIYDAWTTYEPVAQPIYADPSLRRPLEQQNEENQISAVNLAAYHMLTMLFPTYATESGAFIELLHVLGEDVEQTIDLRTPQGIGFLAAQTTLAARRYDGANSERDYADVTSATYPVPYKPYNSPDPWAVNAPGQRAFDANHWQPLRVPTGNLRDEQGYPIMDGEDSESYIDQSFLTPHWGAVTPFALTSGNQLRPSPPPQAGSDAPYVDGLGQVMSNDDAYRAQFAELVSISSHLSDRQKVIAEYWADGPRTETPPGHWNQLAQGVALRDCHTIDDSVKLFFALNATLLDTSIAVWECKRYYDFIRPQSAIRHLFADQWIATWAGPNQGTQVLRGSAWMPYQPATFVTPPFPEYVSGHSAFSAASAAVLTRFTGSDRFYDGETTLPTDLDRNGVPDLLGQFIAAPGSSRIEKGPSQAVILRWETFQAAAEEAALSRRYGGIHIQDGDLRARTLGQQVALQSYRLAESYWSGGEEQ